MKMDLTEGYELDDRLDRLDFDRLQLWLSTTYWSPGISRELIEKGARGSAVVAGCYLNGGQVGFCRVASDKTRIGVLLDVFVDPAHRGKGIGRSLCRFVMAHPDLAPVYIWLLGTKDAHGVYSALGYKPIDPDVWMLMRKDRPF